MNSKKNESWSKKHSNILKYTFNLYQIDQEEFAEEMYISYATIRQWLNGRSFPDKKNLAILYKKLKEKVNANTETNLDFEMRNYLETICPIERDLSEYSPTKYTVAQYLITKLSDCYAKGKQNQQSISRKPANTFVSTGFTKAVIFDFDGTLTMGNSIKTTWESLWIALGYNVQECRDLHTKFDKGEISHSEWCDITAAKFKERGFHRKFLYDVAKKIQLINGCKETFEELEKRYIKIYIVSGSILFVIQKVLNNLYSYVDDVKANDFKFFSGGLLSEIIGTRYDFEGKADYIIDVANNLRISTEDILFVGNSYNDKYAYISGASTLCINPKQTDTSNFRVWNNCIHECSDLRQILNYVNFFSE